MAEYICEGETYDYELEPKYSWIAEDAGGNKIGRTRVTEEELKVAFGNMIMSGYRFWAIKTEEELRDEELLVLRAQSVWDGDLGTIHEYERAV